MKTIALSINHNAFGLAAGHATYLAAAFFALPDDVDAACAKIADRIGEMWEAIGPARLVLEARPAGTEGSAKQARLQDLDEAVRGFAAERGRSVETIHRNDARRQFTGMAKASRAHVVHVAAKRGVPIGNPDAALAVAAFHAATEEAGGDRLTSFGR